MSPDFLTTTMQKKFWDHLSNAYSNLLESYLMHAQNLQHMFTLTLDEKSPGSLGAKATSDICKAIYKMMPSLSPRSGQSKPSNFQAYMDKVGNAALTTTAMMQQIIRETMTLCRTAENRPDIVNVANAIMAMNLNVQSHITALHTHMGSKTALLFPADLPILVSQKTTAIDMEKALNHLTTVELSEEHLIFLYTMMLNELINTVTYLSPLLPESWGTVPGHISLSDQYKYTGPAPSTPKLYAKHIITADPTTPPQKVAYSE